jgi:hypothetical protein
VYVVSQTPSIPAPASFNPAALARQHGALLHQVMLARPAQRAGLLKKLLPLIEQRVPINLSKVAPSATEFSDPALDAAIAQTTAHIAIGSLVDWDDADSSPEILRALLAAYLENGYYTLESVDLHINPFHEAPLTCLDRAIRGGRTVAALVFMELGADITKLPGQRFDASGGIGRPHWIEAGDLDAYLDLFQAPRPETVSAVRAVLMRRAMSSPEALTPSAKPAPTAAARRRQGM